MDKSGQREESPYAVWILGLVVFIALCWIGSCIISKDAGPVEKDVEVQPEATKLKPASVPDWHKAKSREEVVRRIKARLVSELAAYGLDASNIVANAKAHPTRFRGSVPEHDRSRWLVLSTNDEAIIARRYVEECKRQGRFLDDSAMIKRVRSIVERLVAVVPEIDSVPEIHIVRDDSVNACCLPDGTVFVNEGTLKAIPDNDSLAAILAHELGHAAARHGNEDVAHALIGAAGGVAFEEWMAGVVPVLDSGGGLSLIRLAYGLGGAVGFYLPRSRLQESEADRLGVRYLARAGYAPEAMLQFFEWLESVSPEEKTGLAALLRTHPFHSERAEHVREVLLEPDLYEMPEAVSNKLARIAAMGAKLASATNAVPISTNVLAKAKDVTGGAMGMATNLWHRRQKLPFGKGKETQTR